MARYSGRVDELSTLRKAKTEANVEIVANCDGVDCACVGVCVGVGVGVDLPFPLMEGMAGADKQILGGAPPMSSYSSSSSSASSACHSRALAPSRRRASMESYGPPSLERLGII